MKIGIQEPYDKYWLNKYISDEQIMEHYMGQVEAGKKFNCIHRTNKNTPACGLFYTEDNTLLYKDFGNKDIFNSVSLVQKVFGITYYQAIIKIGSDLGIIDNQKVIVGTKREVTLSKKTKNKKLIQIIERPLNREEYQYWGNYLQGEEEVKREKIFGIKSLYIDKKLIPCGKDLKFAYYYPDERGFKIYSPYSPYKWVSNIPISTIEGITSLLGKDKCCIVGKSKKDRMVLKMVYNDVISTQNESEAAVPEWLDTYLEERYECYKCFWDTDLAGKEANKALNKRGYEWINLPNSYLKENIKDPSDLVFKYKEKGLEIIKQEIEKKLKK